MRAERCHGHPRWILVAALLGAALAASSAAAQVSPGPLARPHRSLEGNRQCTQCHPPAGSKERMDDRCLACHQEIAMLRGEKRGLHGRVSAQACAKCHPDHGGAEFEMIAFEEGSPEKFDHARSGYALEGAHARVECRACHEPRKQRAAVAAKLKVSDRGRSWLGLDTACTGCHGDPHRAQLSLDCQKCHTVAAWKPASRFDHAKTAYPLSGRHAALACAKCHASEPLPGGATAAGAAAVTRWKPLSHAECAPCHRDPHAGRFGGACSKCHTTDDFRRLNTASFDHARTRYPLRGAHATVACASCHDPVKAWGAKPAFARCDACHRDAHAGQTARAGAATPDCAACHDVAAFRPSTYSVAAHRESPYPLEGAHARAECALCHAKAAAAAAATLGPARIPLHPEHARCTNCHGDPHAGRFSRGGERPRNEECMACHDMERFAPSHVDVASHASYRFALEGAHRAVPCASCHRELAGTHAAAGTPGRTLAAAARGRDPVLPRLAFHDDRRRCAECHETPHGRQFEARRDRGACESCHTQAAWTPAARFDHARDSGYRLDGRHVKVPCASCHPRVSDATGTRTLYRPLSSRCESCHATK